MSERERKWRERVERRVGNRRVVVEGVLGVWKTRGGGGQGEEEEEEREDVWWRARQCEDVVEVVVKEDEEDDCGVAWRRSV